MDELYNTTHYDCLILPRSFAGWHEIMTQKTIRSNRVFSMVYYRWFYLFGRVVFLDCNNKCSTAAVSVGYFNLAAVGLDNLFAYVKSEPGAVLFFGGSSS